MKVRSQWLDDFFKWFFNASPVWVDERTLTNERALRTGRIEQREPRTNRRAVVDRRRYPDPRGSIQAVNKRSERP